MNFKPDSKIRPKSRGRKPAKKITADYLHNAGLYYLQRFAASRGHFESVMMRKVARSLIDHPEQDPETCREMVRTLGDKFERSGLLDDTAYSKAIVRSLRAQGKSKRYILNKLTHKGLAGDAVEKDILEHDESAYEAEGDFHSALLLARRRKIGPFQKDAEKPFDKIMAQFARAGFSYSVIQKIMALSRIEAEDLLDGAKFK